MKQFSDKLLTLITDKKFYIVFCIFLANVLLRFYKMVQLNPFGWDQVDNAWAAKNIIINHWYPLVGMVAKQNSGFFIGPLYYYFAASIYFFTNLNPVASGIIAGLSSIASFFIIYFVIKKLFSFEAAVIAIVLYTFSSYQIIFDRVQWPVDLVPAVSLLAFYFLYRVLTGETKNLLYLAISAGILFQLHFTAVFIPVIIFLCLPLFPWKKISLVQIFGSIAIFLLFLVPNVIYELQQKNTQSSHMSTFFAEYYHGFHLRRVWQIVGDAFIQFQSFTLYQSLNFLKYMFPIVFLAVYLFKSYVRERIVFCYLIVLWFVVPWVSFSMYSGEISDYYYDINRFVALLVISYLLFRLFTLHISTKIAISLLLLVYMVLNLNMYLQHNDTTLGDREKDVQKKVAIGEQIQFTQGVPESYLYYYYMRQKGITVYETKHK